MSEITIALLALAFGSTIGYLMARTRFGKRERDLATELSREKELRIRAQADVEAVKRAKEENESAFRALASRALEANSKQFLDLAATKFEGTHKEQMAQHDLRKKEIAALVEPLQEKLQSLGKLTAELEGKREKAYGSLQAQISELSRATSELQSSSLVLATALKGSSQARGRWGELALRNIVELAGMTEHCDFDEQSTDDAGLRPDMIVHLPGGGTIPIDAKAPFSHYVQYCESSDQDERNTLLEQHAKALKRRVRELAKRDYAAGQSGTVDFAVMFIPGEPILAAAFEKMPDLQADAMRERVLIATPVTLVALLRTVGIYWRQEKVEENAQHVWAAAVELYKRVTDFREHLAKTGEGLGKAMESYNKAIGSFTSRVVPSGRKLEKLGSTNESKKNLDEIPPIETHLRHLPGQDDGST